MHKCRFAVFSVVTCTCFYDVGWIVMCCVKSEWSLLFLVRVIAAKEKPSFFLLWSGVFLQIYLFLYRTMFSRRSIPMRQAAPISRMTEHRLSFADHNLHHRTAADVSLMARSTSGVPITRNAFLFLLSVSGRTNSRARLGALTHVYSE